MRAVILTSCWVLLGCGPGSPDKVGAGSSTGGVDEAGGGASGGVTSGDGGGEMTGGGAGGETTTTGASPGGEPTGGEDPSAPDPSGQDPSAPLPTTQEPEPEPENSWPPLTMWPVTLLSLTQGELRAFEELEQFVPGEFEPCPLPSCDGNAPPTLGEPIFFVNGAWTATLGQLHVGDRVGVAFEYGDPDCNLVCGWTSSGASGPFETMETGGDTAVLPCASGPGLGIDFTTLEAPGPHTWWIQLEDACQQKALAKGGFEVAP